jgi:hypothetical protein
VTTQQIWPISSNANIIQQQIWPINSNADVIQQQIWPINNNANVTQQQIWPINSNAASMTAAPFNMVAIRMSCPGQSTKDTCLQRNIKGNVQVNNISDMGYLQYPVPYNKFLYVSLLVYISEVLCLWFLKLNFNNKLHTCVNFMWIFLFMIQKYLPRE